MPDWKPAIEEDDQLLDRLFDRAARALAASCLTVQDLLDDLPAVRAEVVCEAYSADFLRELERVMPPTRRSGQQSDKKSARPPGT